MARQVQPDNSFKIVYSTTLHTVSGPVTRIERRFEPDVVRELKAAATRDIAGGGNPYLPDGSSVRLELLDERRFENGIVHVRYRAGS